MSDVSHVFILQNSYIARLKEKIRVIDEKIETGETVTLDFSENTRRLSLKVNRDNVVKIDGPDALRKPASQSDTISLFERVSNSFSFDIGEINRQVSANDIQAQIKEGRGNGPRILPFSRRGCASACRQMPWAASPTVPGLTR